LAVPAVGLNMHPPSDSTSSDKHASLATRSTNLTPTPINEPQSRPVISAV
jgi:hypothetical protein